MKKFFFLSLCITSLAQAQVFGSNNAKKLQGVRICTGTPSDAQVLTYSSANGCWQAGSVAGTGDVVAGVALTTSNAVPKVSGVKTITESGCLIDASNVLSCPGGFSVPATAAGGSVTLYAKSPDTNFRKISVPDSVTADLELRQADALPANSVQVYPTPTAGVSQYSWVNVGTSANNIVQLDSSARLPAVDGSQLTNLPSSSGGDCTVTIAAGTSGIPATPVAGSVNCITGSQSAQTTVNLSNADVTIRCASKAVVITLSSTAPLFAVTGARAKIENCTLDKASAAGGSLITVAADDFLLQNNTLQNGGTATASQGLIYVTQGVRGRLRGNLFATAATEQLFFTNSAAISDWWVQDNHFTVTGEASAIKLVGANGVTNAIERMHFDNLNIKAVGSCIASTTSGTGYYVARSWITNMRCDKTADSSGGSHSLIDLFGWHQGTITGLQLNDGGFAFLSPWTQPYVALHDSVNLYFGQSTLILSGNSGKAIQILDTSSSKFEDLIIAAPTYPADGTLVGNGWGPAQPAIESYCSATNASIGRNKFHNIQIITGPAYTGSIFSLASGTTGCAASDIEFTDNYALGTDTASSAFITLAYSAGTFAGPIIKGNTVKKLKTGISLAASITGAKVGENFFDTVTTPITDSSTTAKWNFTFGVTQATLGSQANGSIVYCSDCTIANPCAGSGTGALAKRLNGAWVCN